MLDTICYLILMLSVETHAIGSYLIGSAATCDNEGEEIFVPYISNDPCIRCVCRNTIVECQRQTCRPLEGCHVILHERPSNVCCDVCQGCSYGGRQYASGTEWSSDVDPCLRFTCQAAVLTRYRVQCAVACRNPIVLKQTCCPVCPGCKIGNRYFEENSTFNSPTDNCVVCICKGGRLMCEKRGCPVLNCLPGYQVTLPGQCCPRCVDHRRVFDVSSFGKCFFQRTAFADKAAVYLGHDACTQCTCMNGTTVCKRRVCPLLDCAVKDNLTSSIDDATPVSCCPQCLKYKRRCLHGLTRYKHGATWKSNSCTNCYCNDGTIRCHVEQCSFNSVECPKNYQVKFRPGECCPECVEANGVCVVFGDPHYRTFDGRLFTFQGPCRYLLAASGTSTCGPTSSTSATTVLPGFLVRVTNVVRGTLNKFTWTKSVSITLINYVNGGTGNGNSNAWSPIKVQIDLLPNLRVLVNRTQVTLPHNDRLMGQYSVVEKPFGGARDKRSGFHGDSSGLRVVVLSTSIGVQVMWDGGSYLELSVPAVYKERMCGLCGNYNGIETDDLTGSDGRFYRDPEQFGASWQLPSRPTCTSPRQIDSSAKVKVKNSGLVPRCMGSNRKNIKEIERHCRTVFSGLVFADCRRVVDAQPYYRSCVMDSCDCPSSIGRSWRTCACNAFTAYGRICQQAGGRPDVIKSTGDVTNITTVSSFRWPCGDDDGGRIRSITGDGRLNDVRPHLMKLLTNRRQRADDYDPAEELEDGDESDDS